MVGRNLNSIIQFCADLISKVNKTHLDEDDFLMSSGSFSLSSDGFLVPSDDMLSVGVKI